MKCISLFKCNPQIEVIDKSHCSLEDVPNFQNYSRSLEELFLNSNSLTVLNDNVFKLTKLRRFSFSDNAILEIPPDIAKLVNLVELDGSKNRIAEIPEQIKFLRGLQICDFSANDIESLPIGIVQLKNLTSLTLNLCRLVQLPQDFGLLKNLESLELRQNDLTALPPSIAGLENLKKLDVGQNFLTDLPDEIGRLTKLEYLLLDDNRLQTISAQIGRLENLQCLDLTAQQQDFKLQCLPEDISGLYNLTDLHLSENHLQTLPDGIRNLKNLSFFKVDGNYLTELNPSIGGCSALRELVLSRNQISKLPTSMGALVDLRSLNIDNNLLQELPSQIGNLKSLSILSLRDNLLTYLPDETGNLSSIQVMDVSGNRLESLPISIASLNLKALWLSKNQAQPLPKLQIDENPTTGLKVFTCYLLPQQSEDLVMDQEFQNQPANDENLLNQHRPAAVSFDTATVDDMEFDHNAQFVRHDTPHPRELRARHQKLFEGTNQAKPELKGLDNASFNIADNQQFNLKNNNINGINYEFGEKQPFNSTGYQHLEYESNGLPEMPLTQSAKSESHVQTTTKLFEAFRHKSTTTDYNGKQHDDRQNENAPRDKNLSKLHNNSAPSQRQNAGLVEKYQSNFQVLDILVRRSVHHKPGLGLSIAGGKDTPPFKDNDEGIFVSKVTRGGPAEAAHVRMGDKILAVNDNLFYDGITHQRAVEIFKKIKPDFKEFSIRVLRDPNDEYSDDDRGSDHRTGRVEEEVTPSTKASREVDKGSISQSAFSRTYTVPIKGDSGSTGNSVNNLRQYLMREPEKGKSNASTLPSGMGLNDTGSSIGVRNNIIYTTLVKDYKHDLGVVLENRCDENESKAATWSNIVISGIKPNSIASRDGKLQADDRLLSINGTDVTGIDLDRIMLMLEGTERFIRIVVSRGDGDDPLGIALRNMPARPSLGSWFSSTSNMAHRPSLIESYQRPTFGSVSSLSKQPTQLLGTKPPKPPKPFHLTTKDSEDSSMIANSVEDDNPVARPRNRVVGLTQSSSGDQQANISDAEKRAAWRRERLKSIEDDVEMAKLIAEAQRRRRDEKQE